jgi:uncharacterized protein (TIGR02145 family)
MKTFSSIIIAVIVLTASISAQQRGLKIIANDKSGVPKEIPLYNKSYAVIIGIDRYKNLDYNFQLKNAVSDAKGVHQTLNDKYIFDKYYELYNENASKENILKTLQGDLAAVTKDDAIFVFYAGHGYTQSTQFGDEIGYIVPYDGSMKDDEMYKNISMIELRDNIAKTLNAKHIFFVMDACYSGTLLRRGGTAKEQTVDYEYLKTITETAVRQVLTAGGKNEQVLDGGYKNHSIFTGRFIEKLEKAENYITATELGSYVPKKVVIDASDRNHKQNPQFGYLLGEGDFVFICKSMQNVNSEDVLANELKKLQEENLKLETAKKDKEYQENQRKQEELKRQMALLEEKKKLAELEKARKEEETRKALEEEKRKKELLAKIELEKQKQSVSVNEDMSYKEALNKITEIKTKIAQIDKEYDEQKTKAIKLAIDESPRGEFETKQEYDQRLTDNRIKTKQVSDEYENLKDSNKKIYTDELNSVTSRKYAIGKDKLSIKLGTYNVDAGYFPVTVTETKEYDPCDKNPVQNYVNSRIYIVRNEAKQLRENESLLDIKATLLVSADEKLMIDKITLIDAVNNKNYEFTANMRISMEYGTFTDPRDGKTYKTLKIGGQTWMAENLNYDAGSGTYCYDDKSSNCAKYGKLYTWEAAKRAVPQGWRLPNKADFEKLLEYLDCKGNRYQQITNSSGFNALFGGYRNSDGDFANVGSDANFWSSSENGNHTAWYLYVGSSYQTTNMNYYSSNNAFSVRLLKD